MCIYIHTCIYIHMYMYIYLYTLVYIYMSHRNNPGETKYVLDGHWFMEIDGN
jgi:hypothetical protein